MRNTKTVSESYRKTGSEWYKNWPRVVQTGTGRRGKTESGRHWERGKLGQGYTEADRLLQRGWVKVTRSMDSVLALSQKPRTVNEGRVSEKQHGFFDWEMCAEVSTSL